MRYLGLVLVGIFIIAANVAVVLVHRYERRPRKSECVKNLKDILKKMDYKRAPAWGLDRSSRDFSGKLLELFKGEKSALADLNKAFVCPFCRSRGEHDDFSYAGPFIPEKHRKEPDKDEPVLWDRPENHPDGVHVAYWRADGPVVEFLSREEFSELKVRLEKESAKFRNPKKGSAD